MINNIEIETENSVNLLGLTIDSNFTFSNHISELCKRARNRLAALRRMRFFISEDKAALLASTFVMSRFNYSPLIWMFCSKFDNASINKIHKRELRTVYQDFSFLFCSLLNKSNAATVHIKNLQVLMTEVYKFVNGIGLSFMSEIFKMATEKYNVRTKHRLLIPKVRSVKNVYQSVSFRAAVIWNQLPNIYKQSKTLASFKIAIKQWDGKAVTAVLV